MMKSYFILVVLSIFLTTGSSQKSFIFSLEQPGFDYISDVIQVSDNFYFIQNRLSNLGIDFDSDSYSDLLITTADGVLLEQYNLNGYRTHYMRILKVQGDTLFLVGFTKSDTCASRLIISKFNIISHTLEHVSSFDFCNSNMQNIVIKKGLSNSVFIQGYYYSGGFPKFILRMDSNYILTPLFDNLGHNVNLTIDFARNGYLIMDSNLCDFYDSNFNLRKQRFTNEPLLASNQTHTPFGSHYILEQTLKSHSFPDGGQQIRLIDSNLMVKKKAVINPSPPYYGSMDLPYFGGIDIANENEIWASGRFGLEINNDSTIYSITKVDSNLNIQCQHFLGYDSWYRIYGIRALETGGAIIYGNRVRNGLDQNEGEDIFALRVGENCELPTTSIYDPLNPFISISAYPNPGINDLTFSVQGFDPTTLRMEMIDVLGSVLFSASDLTNSIQVPDLPAGQYFYRILQKDKLLGVGSWVKE